jgi:hypothetical protein
MSEDQGTEIMGFGAGKIKSYYPPDTECDFGYRIRMNDGKEMVVFGVSDDGLSIDSISCTGVDDATTNKHAGCAVRFGVGFVILDHVFHSATGAINFFVKHLGPAGQIGDDEADITTLRSSLNTGNDFAFPWPTPGLITNTIFQQVNLCSPPNLRRGVNNSG